ncbi:MAG: hypothetical protein IJ491_01555 [Clostridia bacterium]|nr:hypothetical protein [Clostridia bacterium]
MMSKTMIKIICIIMAALMLLSACAVLVQVFAADEGVMTYVGPATGDSGSDYYVPAGIAVAAVLAVVLCLVLPKLKKKEAVPNVKNGAEKASEQKKAEPQKKKSAPVVRTVGRTVDRDGGRNKKTDKK